MSISPGTRLGPYEVTAQIGAGGMGEVYRATDSNLKRAVAIKVLPASVAADAERLARFQREAEVLASLNHPNIAAIYGLERSAGTTALVLELVEGPTLADRIAQGPIPLEETLPIARQIADALEAAHEHGIIHRDLKPANIKLRPDGAVKVLDFGLAKAFDPDAGSKELDPAFSHSPTLTTPAATRVGVIMGTAAYMSPEQAKGKTTDKRTDIWAFGCVLYEMLTGKRAFEGEDVFDTLGAVAKGEPAWEAMPPTIPPNIRKLLRRCLEKDRKHRLADMADAELEIEDALAGPTEQSTLVVAPARTMRRERLAWSAAVLLAVVATSVLTMSYFRASAALPEMRLEITTPATTDPNSFALSPDGRRLAFVASGDGQPRLWVRPFESTSAQPLVGTEGASLPFWSPDSRSVGFVAGNKLKRIDIGGGLPQTLADASTNSGGAWNSDGVILFARNTLGALSRIQASASGGESVEVTKPTPRQNGHSFPSFLPGGRQFLFYASGTPEVRGIYLGSLDSPDTKRLTASDGAGAYAPPGWLLFVRQGTFVARHFDLARREIEGDEVTLASPIVSFSLSATGLVGYRSGGKSQRQLIWVDRAGKDLGSMGAPDENSLSAPRLSPDGRRVAVMRSPQANPDIWLLDTVRTVRFTFDPAEDRYPIWSPDGRGIVFDSNRKGHRDLYRSSNPGSEELLVESAQDKTANDWSPDGRFIVYQSNDPRTGFDLWVLPLEGDRKPFVFLKTNFNERRAAFSPDGRWVTYLSNESGRYEVYARPFPGPNGAAHPAASLGAPGATSQISTTGGIQPYWSRDGEELYYIAPDAKLMASPIKVTGGMLEAGAPVALFQTRILGAASVDAALQYDVARDGRFLINTVINETSPITVILNWTGLRK